MIRTLSMRFPVLLLLATCLAPVSWTQNSEPIKPELSDARSGLYMKVQLTKSIKPSKLHPGDVVEGSIAADVYTADRKLLSSGDRARLTVDHFERRRREASDHWPGVIELFRPRHEKYPVFGSVDVTEASSEHEFRASQIGLRRMRAIYAKGKTANQLGQENSEVKVSHSGAKKSAAPTLVLEAFEKNASAVGGRDELSSGDLDSRAGETLPVGTRFKVVLLGNVSASKSKAGDVVQARLLEPVLLNSQVAIPAGSLLEGKVVKNRAPRWLSRAGSLYLSFNNLVLPKGNRVAVVGSLAGAELDQRSHTHMDAEGRLQGERPGKAWMAINLGVAVGVTKVADDSIQVIIEAIVSTATDVSTAGTGRIVAGCASAVYLATRKGRDVVLPRFTEMEVALDRPASLDSITNGTPTKTAGGK